MTEAFVVNSDDLESMILLKEPLLEHPPEPPPEEHSPIIPRTAPPPPSSGEEEDPGADFTKAKVGQLGSASKRRLLEILREGKAFFPSNTKLVNIIKGREVVLPLYNEDVRPFACKAQRFNPHVSDALMKQINDMIEAGILCFATLSGAPESCRFPKKTDHIASALITGLSLIHI